jgi:hypothetical protein
MKNICRYLPIPFLAYCTLGIHILAYVVMYSHAAPNVIHLTGLNKFLFIILFSSMVRFAMTTGTGIGTYCQENKVPVFFKHTCLSYSGNKTSEKAEDGHDMKNHLETKRLRSLVSDQKEPEQKSAEQDVNAERHTGKDKKKGRRSGEGREKSQEKGPSEQDIKKSKHPADQTHDLAAAGEERKFKHTDENEREEKMRKRKRHDNSKDR